MPYKKIENEVTKKLGLLGDNLYTQTTVEQEPQNDHVRDYLKFWFIFSVEKFRQMNSSPEWSEDWTKSMIKT